MRDAVVNAILERSLSPERLAKYLIAANGNLHDSLGLYERNTRLSEAFYTPLQCMEICLRNKLNDRLIEKYGPEWFKAGRAPLRQDAAGDIEKSLLMLNQARNPITIGALVAELGIGFWVGLLGPRYDATLWRGTLYRAFQRNGRYLARNEVHGRFNALRRLRNRIAHHEPIFQKDLPAAHNEIIEATNWMCQGTARWAMHHSRFVAVWNSP